MRKILFLSTALLFLSTMTYGQVFNTGQTLKPKRFSIGVEPSFILNGDSAIHAVWYMPVMGLKTELTLAMKFGFFKCITMNTLVVM